MTGMTDGQATTELVKCAACNTPHFVSDLVFPEPDEDTNTQFGWLVANCPACGSDIKVGLDKIGSFFMDAAED